MTTTFYRITDWLNRLAGAVTPSLTNPIPLARVHSHRSLIVGVLLIVCLWLQSLTSVAQDPFVSLSVPLGTTPSSFTQTFDGLPATGNITIGATLGSLVGTNANGIYTNQLLLQTSTGAPNVVNLVPLAGQYSFGPSGSTDRALGSNSNLTNAVLTPIRYGLLIRNTTGMPLRGLSVAYTGEQWYRDGDGSAQVLQFDYTRQGASFNLLNALGLLVGDVLGAAYTPVADLNFVSKNNTGPTAILDGNSTANRSSLSGIITFSTPLGVNEFVLLRWSDVNDAEGLLDLLDTDHSLAIDDLMVTAIPVNQAPVLTGTGITSPQTATVGVGYSTATAQAFRDPNGDALTYSASPLPAGVSINAGTGIISGTPSSTVGSPFSVQVTARDPAGATVSTSYVLTVVNANQAPVLTGTGITSPQTATVGVGYSTATAHAFRDPNGDALTYSASPLPAGVSINAGTGIISGTPSSTVGSPFSVQVTARDPAGASVSTSYVLNVVNANQAPVLTGTGITSPQTATVGVGYSTATAQAFRDPNGDALTYSAGPLPAGVSINAGTGIISGTPSSTVGSPFSVQVTARDPAGASVSTSYLLNVVPVTPVCGSNNVDGSPLRATIPLFDCAQLTTSGRIQFTATGGDPRGGPVEFKSIGITDWTTNCSVVVDRETRTACDAAPLEIQVRQLVNGVYVYGKSYIFNIRQVCPIQGCPGIQPGNRAPVVNAGIPDQVTRVGQPFDYIIPQNTFFDADGDQLLYTASRLPDGFNYSSGRFMSGPISVAQTISVTVTAFDNSGGSAFTTFRIIVSDNGTASPTCGSSSLDGSPLRATMPVYDCNQLTTTGAMRLTAAGGNAQGGTVEFRAIGVTDWTSACAVTIDQGARTACDAAPIQIDVRQLVNGSYVYGTSYTFNLRQACPAGCTYTNARQAAPESRHEKLGVVVLGNPTQQASVQVMVSGADGQALRMRLVDSRGRLVSDTLIDRADRTQEQTVPLGNGPGLYLLRVSTVDQTETVKIIRQ